MLQCKQLDFLNENFENQEIEAINQKVENIRKGIFKRHTELSKFYLEIRERQEKIESNLYAINQFLKDKFQVDISFDGTFNF